jgi:hypothetical protein
VSSLESNEKLTRIFSAKSLFIIASRNVLAESTLLNIREYVSDIVPDVSIYGILAYTEGLNKLVKTKA